MFNIKIVQLFWVMFEWEVKVFFKYVVGGIGKNFLMADLFVLFKKYYFDELIDEYFSEVEVVKVLWE